MTIIQFKNSAHLIVLLASLSASSISHAFNVERFAPKGQQQQVKDVKVRFSEDMVRLGSSESQSVRSGAGTALSVQCNGKNMVGQLQWINTREAIINFDSALPAASNCVVNLSSQLKSVAGKSASALPDWRFSTGDPVVTNTWPNNGADITETQVFVIASNVAAGTSPAQTLAQLKPVCVTDKVGEQIDFNLLPAAERSAIVTALNDELPKDTAVRDALIVGRCARPLGDGAKVRLILGNRATKQEIAFRTLPALRASISCEREKSESPCVPVQTIKLLFSVPVSSKSASLVTLVSATGKTKQSTLALRNALAKKQGLLTGDDEVTELDFAAPFEENAQYTVQFPSGDQAIKDTQARPLTNGAANALRFQTAEAPPLAKFAANFGVIERQVGALPVTIRNMKEAQGDALKLRSETTVDEKTVIQWMRMADFDQRNERTTRRIPILANGPAKANNVFADPLKIESTKAAQVIGIPLKKPGLHRVELESAVLGKSMLATDSSETASPKMYVRSYALVTSMAVHIKSSEQNALVWVTSLETGQVIPGASIKIADCNGQFLWEGTTDASGIARIDKGLPKSNCHRNSLKTRALFGLPAGKIKRATSEGENEEYIAQDQDWLIAFARHNDDFAFALTTWNQGIEAWRFNINTSGRNRESAAWFGHTIFARTLLRQGETVHMKHLFRKTATTGLVRPPIGWNKKWTKLRVTHLGSDQTWDVPLTWSDQSTGISQWVIPTTAKLGMYNVVAVSSLAADASGEKENDGDSRGNRELDLGSFQVAQFKLPTLKGVIDMAPDGPAAKGLLKLNVQMSFLNGGPAAGQSTTVSVLASPHTPVFTGYDEFNFSSVAATFGIDRGDGSGELPKVLAGFAQSNTSQIIADKVPLNLDGKGSGQLNVTPPSKGQAEAGPPSAKQIRVEVNYSDPNGEIQTISNSKVVFPAQWVMGFKSGGWLDESTGAQKLVVLSTKGEPVASAAIKVEGFQRINHSARKRTVGGFYTYENRTEYKAVGEVCAGNTNAQGMFDCKLSGSNLTNFSGNLMLLASARDKDGVDVNAATSIYRGGGNSDDANWFEQENSDRIDLIAEKRVVAAGETARIQVRLPFERATALLAVEREGIIQTRVVEINRNDPVVTIPITGDYAPNVMVSVLAIRPRVEPITWGSFFSWGWRSPIQWWKAKQKSQLPPTALVDLAKPAFRFGVVELKVPATAGLKVAVTTPSIKVQPRELVKATIQITGPDPKQQAAIKDGRVAVAVVDEALLELSPNTSWDLVAALWQPGAWGVETATAQMQVIGKRHFGLKAQAPGGGGSGARGPTRELFDTLAYWNPNVQLDAQGKAVIEFKANDSLTRFRVMVFAESGDSLLGTGSTTIDVVKDIQLIAGLPSIVRQGDQVNASTTIRNTTDRTIKAQFTASMNGAVVVDQALTLAPQSTQIVALPINMNEPINAAADRDNAWILAIKETGTNAVLASDSLTIKQPVLPAVATRIIAGQLMRIDGTTEVPFQLPSTALAGRSAIKVEWASSIVGSLAGVRRYFIEYPFACLEQRTAKSIGLQDTGLWDVTMTELPNYLDKDGLAAYWPLSGNTATGDIALTAHLMRIAHAAGRTIPQASQDQMIKGLTAIVEGKLKRNTYVPVSYSQYGEVVRRLSAMEALARYDRVDPAMLSSIKVEVDAWPTSAVIDWVSILTRVKFAQTAIKDRDQKLDDAWAVLRNRLQFDSRSIKFSSEDRDGWWWMLADGDTNAARLLDTVLDDRVQTRAGIAQWLQDLPRLASGLSGRQRSGHWSTTASNLWASLAITRYAKAFERDAVTGSSNLALKLADTKVVDGASSTWQGTSAPASVWPWAATAGKEATAVLTHTGSGKPYAAVLLEAAVPLKAPVNAGFSVSKTITPVTQAKSGQVSVGDVYRVDLTINAAQSFTQVAVLDPIPAGASILGSLRESQIEQTKSDGAKSEDSGGGRFSHSWPAFDEKRFDSYRVFYNYLHVGKTAVSYTIRISQSGTMKLPATRVEAMYAPEQYGETPNADWVVVAK